MRKQLVEEGLEAVLSRKAPAAPAVPRIFDGEKEARLIALACSKTARGIRALELAAVGDEGGGARHRPGRQRQHDPARAQKNALQPHRRKYWVIPPKASGAFVAAMEDVLSVYTRPRDPDRPLVCLDETSKQLVAETRSPVAMRPGRPARVDYEYARNGVANLFMMFAPLEGWRNVKVTDRRTAVDYAHALKDLADVHFAQAETIVLIQDNLNTHSAASLYQAFPAAEARAPGRALPMALHAETRLLAGVGRIRTRRPRLAMPRPAHPRYVKPGAFIGVAALPGDGGVLKAMEVHVFPEAMRGTGEGFRPFDLAPGSTTTNGTIATRVEGVDGEKLTVTFKGGEQTIVVDPKAPVVGFAPGTRADLKPGAAIIARGARQEDGSVDAARILVGKDGLVPPL